MKLVKQILFFLCIFSLIELNAKPKTGSQDKRKIKQINALFKSMTVRDFTIENYLRDNKIYNVQVTNDGLYYKVDSVKKSIKPQIGDFVTVRYGGSFLDSTNFELSKDRNAPYTFQLGKGMVIQGWEKGIPLFNIGEKGRLYIPAKMAYGEQGKPNVIAPYTPLIFDIEILTAISEADKEALKQKELSLAMEKVRISDSINKAKQKIEILTTNLTEKQMIDKYINDNGLKTITLPSGLIYVIDEQGKGAKVENGKTAFIHYTGTLLNGNKFDSSRDRGQPFSFVVGTGRVIKGWDEGLPYFNVGGKGKLIIPPSLGYGSRSMGPSLPANSVLVFDIEVMDVR